ncbi:MAG: hypothetical protein II621_09785, partial [Clostridia bacterium]|nr:hypothetical protein [Clostridia bacterium]
MAGKNTVRNRAGTEDPVRPRSPDSASVYCTCFYVIIYPLLFTRKAAFHKANVMPVPQGRLTQKSQESYAPLRVEKSLKAVYNYKNKQERDLRMIQRLHSLRKNKSATLRSLKKLDDNICLLDYRNDYHLPELLNRGVSSIGELTAFAADALTLGLRLFKPGTDQGAGCTTFEAYTPEGNHLLARNFDFKTAPCFVVWTHPDHGYASVSVVDTNFMAYGNALRL